MLGMATPPCATIALTSWSSGRARAGSHRLVGTLGHSQRSALIWAYGHYGVYAATPPWGRSGGRRHHAETRQHRVHRDGRVPRRGPGGRLPAHRRSVAHPPKPGSTVGV